MWLLCGSKNCLKKHTSQSHEIPNIQDLITCNECDYETISENDLKDHMKVNHMEDVDSLPSNYEDYPEVDEAELDEWIAKAAKEKGSATADCIAPLLSA